MLGVGKCARARNVCCTNVVNLKQARDSAGVYDVKQVGAGTGDWREEEEEEEAVDSNRE